MAPPYAIVTINLATATLNPQELDTSRGKRLAAVSIRTLPTGQVMQLQFGLSGQLFTVVAGDAFEVCPPDVDGLYLTVPAGGSGTATIMLSYEGPESTLAPNP